MRLRSLFGLPLVLSLVACNPATTANPASPSAGTASPTPAASASAAAATPAATTNPATAAASPITISAAAWQGKSDDKVGVNNRMTPNGKKDGHIRITLDGPADVTIKAMAIKPVDKAAGDFSTWTPDNKWAFGIFDGDKLLNSTGYSTDLAIAVNGGKTLDLYAEGEWAGGVVYFQSGMAYDVIITDSKGQKAAQRFTVS